METLTRFRRYSARLNVFINSVVAPKGFDHKSYRNGLFPIECFEDRLGRTEDTSFLDYREDPEFSLLSYEEALYAHIVREDFAGVLLLIGGIGSGKSTTSLYIRHLATSRRDVLQSIFPCSCKTMCRREPVYVDCNDLLRERPRGEIILTILRRIRIAIYETLIDTWLLLNKASIASIRTSDREYRVLRRLLIANDIANFCAEDGHDVLPVKMPLCRLSQPLLEQELTQNEIMGLIRQKSNSVHDLDDSITKALNLEGASIDFTAVVLRFYLSACSPISPLNTIVVDNLDHIVTEVINDILHVLNTLSSTVPGVRMLVPLRPSSLMLNGFIGGFVRPFNHFSPDSAELILERIENHVLLPSRDSLTRAVNASLGRHSQRVTGEEVDSLLVSSWLYASVLSECSKLARVEGGDLSFTRAPRLNSQYESSLRLLDFTSQFSIRNSASTLNALVGTSARYAITQALRFFGKIYSDGRILNHLLLAMSRQTAENPSRLILDQGLLMETLLGDWKTDDSERRLVNIYRPISSFHNPNIPTLAKLRILSYLSRHGRASVRAILSYAAAFALPAETTIEALNYMHEKHRLLLWFSRNVRIDLAKESDLAQHVVISEHGARYLRDVAGDFEYIWFCATDIPPLAPNARPEQNFRYRIEHYHRLMKELAHLELLQACFFHLRSGYVDTQSFGSNSTEFLGLYLTYCSLERAAGGLFGSLAKQQHNPIQMDSTYRDQILELCTDVCKLALDRQSAYRSLFGNTGYLDLYSARIKKVLAALHHLRKLQVVDESPAGGPAALIDRLVAELSRDSYRENPWYSELDVAATYIEKLVEGSYFAPHAANAAAKLISARRKVGAHLAFRVPTFSALTTGLSRIVELETLMLANIGPDSGSMASSISEEKGWMEEALRQLESLRYDNPTDEVPVGRGLDERKAKMNQILDIARQAADRLGARDTSHLDLRWSLYG